MKKKKTQKDKKQTSQRMLLKPWKLLQEKVGVTGRSAINETLGIEQASSHKSFKGSFQSILCRKI